MTEKQASADVREGIRSGIVATIRQDVEQRGGRTARRLLAAGLIGVVGALGVTLLVSSHPYGHHPPWHVVVFSTVWAGLLVVSSAVALLDVRTPGLPLARSASIGILGVGLAGICGAVCPDQHFLHWWSATGVGDSIAEHAGLGVSSICFGLVTTLVIGLLSAFLVLCDGRQAVAPFLPTAVLVVLLTPGVALQSVGTSVGVFAGWLAGTAAGAYVGVAAGAWLGERLPLRRRS